MRSACARVPAEEVTETVGTIEARGVRAVGEAVNVETGRRTKRGSPAPWKRSAAATFPFPTSSVGGGTGQRKVLGGTARGCELSLLHLEKSGQGSVVIIGSTNAVETFVAPMAYNAMKAALITYSKQLSQLSGARTCALNTVSPGPIYFEGCVPLIISQAPPSNRWGPVRLC